MSSTAAQTDGTRRLTRAAWEAEMKRLRICNRLFGTITLTLVARLLKSGVSAAGVAAPALIGALFVASLWLSHLGQGIEFDPETIERQ
jgi:hypothetical protein